MKKLLRALSIEKGEEGKVFLLLFQSFFIGIFVASYEVIASGLFVDEFTENESMMPKAIMLSGVVGIFLAVLFARVQSILKFNILAVFNLLFIFAVAFGLRLAFFNTDSHWLIFGVFLMIGPLNVIAFLGFWGSAGRLFTLRQGKRLFGLVDSGLIIGMILISSLVPVLQWLLPDMKDILYVSAGAALAALIVQLIIARKFGKEMVDPEEEGKGKKTAKTKNRLGWGKLLSNKFTLNLTLFVTFSMMAAFFIWSTFLRVAEQNYPVREEVTNFFGVYMALAMGFTLLIKTVLYSRIMKTYGLKVTLVAICLLMLLLSIITGVVGNVFGYDQSSESFMLFFLVMSLTRLFSLSLKYGIENPAQKLFFQPIDRSVRYDVQAKIEGTINELAGIIAGGLLFVIFSYLDQIFVIYILLGILVMWTVFAFRLYREYQNTLKQSLAKLQAEDMESSVYNDNKFEVEANHALTSGNQKSQMISMNMAQSIEPVFFRKSLRQLLMEGGPELKRFALYKIQNLNLKEKQGLVTEFTQVESNPELKDMAFKVLEKLASDQGDSKSEAVDILMKSRNPDSRILAIQHIMTDDSEKLRHMLADFIRDVHPEVKEQLILAIADMKEEKLYSFVVDQLAHSSLKATATAALISLGEDVLDELETGFKKSGFGEETLQRIVKIMGIIGGDKAIGYLLEKLSFPSVKVNQQAIRALRACEYEAAADERNQLHQLIEIYISNLSWYIAAKEEIDEKDYTKELRDAIETEMKTGLNYLYMLLSLAYDTQTVDNIRENIDSGTAESISYAIELLDLVVTEDMKPKLFPLLEDVPISDKINQLRVNFPREDYDNRRVLYELINRDPNYTNRWTKSCAINCILTLKEKKVEQDLVAHIFNEDDFLCEKAAVAINKINAQEYSKIADRLTPARRMYLNKILDENKELRNEPIYERLRFLMGIEGLKNVSGFSLSKLAERIDLVHLQPGEVFESGVQSEISGFMVVREGRLQLKAGTETINLAQGDITGNYFVPENIAGEYIYQAENDTFIYVVTEDDLQDLLYENEELVHAFCVEVSLPSEKITIS